MEMVQVWYDGPLGRVSQTEELDYDALKSLREFIRPYILRHVSNPAAQGSLLDNRTIFNISDIPNHDERLEIYDAFEALSKESEQRARTE